MSEKKSEQVVSTYRNDEWCKECVRCQMCQKLKELLRVLPFQIAVCIFATKCCWWFGTSSLRVQVHI